MACLTSSNVRTPAVKQQPRVDYALVQYLITRHRPLLLDAFLTLVTPPIWASLDSPDYERSKLPLLPGVYIHLSVTRPLVVGVVMEKKLHRVVMGVATQMIEYYVDSGPPASASPAYIVDGEPAWSKRPQVSR